MSAPAPTGGLPRDARAGLFVLALVLAAIAVLVVGVRFFTTDSPRAKLANSSGPAATAIPLEPGESYVRTEVLPSGDLVVTQWISSGVPLDSILLSPPGVVEGARRVIADQIRVVADDRVVDGAVLISGQPRRYSVKDATSVQITYRLNGAVERSNSAPGRALARITALDVSYDPAPETVTRTVVAAEVLSLACAPPVNNAEERPCGSQLTKGEWTVELVGPQAADRVMAQLTLEQEPAPGG